MTEKRFEMGDYTNCQYNICEILKDGEYYCTVATKDVDLIINVLDENEQLKQQLNKVLVLLDIKQKISKENMEEWAFKDVPASTTREYYYSGMLDACMQLRDEILNGDVE